MEWNAPARTTERRSPPGSKASFFCSNFRGCAFGGLPSCVSVRLCISYTKEVVIGRMLSPSESKVMNATTIPECQTLNITEAASALGVCKETVRRLVRRKVLRKLPGLRRILIPKAEVLRYLDTGLGVVPLKTPSKSGPEVAQKKNPFA